MMSEGVGKPQSEDGLKSLLWEWYRQRAEVVHRRVSAYELLRRNGVRIRQVSESKPEQIPCPFHGQDNKPSARVYPDAANRPSHVWCYVCQKSWDVIGLQMQFSGGIRFSQALSELERAYGIETPPMPNVKGIQNIQKAEAQQDLALTEFQKLYAVSESRLKYAKESYKVLDDLAGYIQCGSILDKICYRVENRRIDPVRGTQVLQQLLTKIKKKIEQGNALLETPHVS